MSIIKAAAVQISPVLATAMEYLKLSRKYADDTEPIESTKQFGGRNLDAAHSYALGSGTSRTYRFRRRTRRR